MSRRIALLLACNLLAVGPLAGATEFCVDTPSELGAAMTSASLASGTTTIRIVRGTYAIAGTSLDGDGFFDVSDRALGALQLLGGYDPGCGGRDIDPANTVLNGATMSETLLVNWDLRGDVTVEGLSFVSYRADLWLTTVRDNVDVVVRRVVVRQSSSQIGDAAALRLQTDEGEDGAHFRVVNSLFHSNAADCALLVFPADLSDPADADIEVVHSTFAGNADKGLCVRSTSRAKVYDNILFGNGSAGVDVQFAQPLMVHNTYDDYQGPAFAAGSTGNLTGNPQFVLPAGDDYRLQSSSPAINSAFDAPPGGQPASDIDGGPRQVGSHADRGAFESIVDDALVLTVTNDNNAGSGSLRQALLNANDDPGLNIIRFDVPGGCPVGIAPATDLPAITDTVIIDGYSQPGSARNDAEYAVNATICVLVRGQNDLAHAFQVPDDAPAATELHLYGIGMGGFLNSAVDLQGGRNHSINGNHFGSGLPGSGLGPNNVDVRLGDGSSDSIIGGSDPGQRNVIGSADLYGIDVRGSVAGPGISASHGNTIVNNFIGIGRDGVADLGNGSRGILLDGYDNTVEANVISGNGSTGISLQGEAAFDNVIRDNRIGTTASGVCFPPPCSIAVPNGLSGIALQGEADDNTIRDNTIAYNATRGIQLSDGNGNAMRGNAIYGNGDLGIDLDVDGVTPNDNDGALLPPGAANRRINFPEITDAQHGRVEGTFRSLNGTYRLEIFVSGPCDASGHGEGLRYVKTITRTVSNAPLGNNGSVAFDTTLPGTVGPIGNNIAMTATDEFGNTSEFSQCVPYLDDELLSDGFE